MRLIKTKKVLKTVYLPEEHVVFISETGERFSDFVRQAVEERIQLYSGYDKVINKMRDQIEADEITLTLSRQKLARLEMRRDYEAREKEIKDTTSLIIRAINNVDYKNIEDATEDLWTAKGSLSDEVFKNLVERIWVEYIGPSS